MNKKMNWGRILLSGASLAAMGAFSPAFAQDDDTLTETVIVTATGRAAAVQDVPLAVTGLGAEALENAGVDNLTDIEQVVPSFRIYAGQSTTAGTIARIRGIGTGADNPGFESAVGIFIDGVYRARSGAAMADLPELERVEVLRGPQGTLFGRNTSAGAISVITAGPEFDHGAWGEVSAGNLGLIGARLGMTGPVIDDKLALRVDGSYSRRDGYIEDVISGNDINTRDRWTARGQLLWDIDSDTSLRLIIDGAASDELCCGITPLQYGALPQAAINAVVGPDGTVPGRVGNLNTRFEEREMTVTPGRDYSEATEEIGISAQIDKDLGNGIDLTSITAVRAWDATRNQDVDFNLLDLAYRDGLEIGFDTVTQEIRLHGEWGRVDWLVGMFYGNENLVTTDNIRLGTDVNAYINALTAFGTAGLSTAAHPSGLLPAVPGPVTGPFEFFDTTPGTDDDNPFIGQTGNVTAPAAPQDPAESIFYFAGLGGFHPFPNIPPNIFFPAGIPSNALLQNAYLTPSPAGSGQQGDRWEVDTQSLALFTHNEISLSEDLILTVGLRYNRETKNLNADLTSVNPTCLSMQGLELATDASVPGDGGIIRALAGHPSLGALITLSCNPAINPIANGQWQGDSEENEFSGTVNLAYHITEDMMAYGGYSRGYKSGGFNVDRSGFNIFPYSTDQSTVNTDDLAFDPEFVDAFELGLKSTWFNTTDVNVNLFYQQLHDYQSNNFNGFNFITRNIPEAISQGVELDVLSRLTDRLTIQGGALYNEAYYDSTLTFNPADPGPNTIYAGQAFDHAPLWSVTSAVTYEQPLTDNLAATFYLDARHNSGYRNQTLSRNPITDQEAFTVMNGRVSLGNPGGAWALELWGRNLTDEFYTVGAFQATLQTGTFVIYPGEPRTWGVTLKARY